MGLVGRDKALVQSGNRYDNRFRTNPDPTAPAASLSFAVIGDFGVGVKKDSPTRRQQQVADALRRIGRHRRRAADPHDRRQHLRRRSACSGIPIGGSGDEDDDWFFTYFQPYRYVINRIPVYPVDRQPRRRRNRRARRSRAGRRQLLPARAHPRRGGRGPRLVLPGVVLPVPLRLRHRVRVHRHVQGRLLPAATGCSSIPKHWEFVEASFPDDRDGDAVANSFRAPSAVLRRPAAPQHAEHAASHPAVRSAPE